jgi:hypothetical protein
MLNNPELDSGQHDIKCEGHRASQRNVVYLFVVKNCLFKNDDITNVAEHFIAYYGQREGPLDVVAFRLTIPSGFLQTTENWALCNFKFAVCQVDYKSFCTINWTIPYVFRQKIVFD